MLQLTDVQIAYEGETILSGITFHVSQGERVALVGANGTGKSSILKAIAGLQEVSGGSVNILSGRTVAYLPQDSYVAPGRSLHDEMLSVFQDVLALEERQRELEARMSGLDGDGLQEVLDEYAHLQSEFDRLGGYTIETEVGTVLHGLGFSTDDSGRQVAEFSGGWQSRIALGKILLKHPDLLLLDEPTNHLDLHATEWLEEYLARYSGGLMLVSHDRYFLDKTTNRTLELERGALTDYPGNYSWYVGEKDRRREQQADAYERQQKELERQQVFIDRFRAKATKARAVQSREKMVDRIERIEAPPPRTQQVRFRFSFGGDSGREVFDVKHVQRKYGEREVLKGVNLLVERGEKIAVVGPNGAGKSTLLKLLAGVEKPTSGNLTVGHNVRRAYFAQHQAELLESGRTAYDEVLRSAGPGWTVTEVRSLLGRFLFSGDDVHKPIEVLSGGERSRVALLKMLLEPANTLLLDEPTNHLDIATRDVLEEAIRAYQGTCIVISHDRYFLDRVATKTLEVEDGVVTAYFGNYSEYRERKAGTYEPIAQPSAPPTQPSAPQRKPQGRTSERDLRKLRVEVASLEREIAGSEERLREVEAALADPELYGDSARYGAMLKEYGELQGHMDDLNGRWEGRASELQELDPPEPPASHPSVPPPDPASQDRLKARFRELEALLEDPDVLKDDERVRVLMDEYAQVYEALADAPAIGNGSATPRTAARQRPEQAPPPRNGARRTREAPEDEHGLRTRLGEVEQMLMDPEIFLDNERSVPIVEEYERLRERLGRLGAGARAS